MTQNKTTKRALLTSALSLLLCCTMLIGTTWAWFTDSVTSSGNIIKSGTLNVEMKWAEGDEDPANTTTWTDASTGAIFNNELWEPGYVDVKHIKIENVGTLAFKYQIMIKANGELETNANGHTLADAIDVYYVDPATQVADRATFNAFAADQTPIKLSDFLTNNADPANNTAQGVLYPEGKGKDSDIVTIALKMREDAGNEYQNMSIGTDFSVQLLATQWTYEEDTFDDQYDVNATFDVSDVQGFTNALSNASDGDTISIVGNMKLDSPMTINKDITIDGNGNAVIMEKPLHIGANNKVTFKDVAFSTVKSNSSNASFVYASNFAGEFNVIGCTFTDTQWDSIQMTPVDGAVINIENCTFNTTDNLKNVHDGKSERYIHIQAAADANVTVSIQGNTFNNIDKVRNSVIDIDYINTNSKVTVGKNTFSGKEVNASNLDDVIYVCVGSSSAQVATMDTYNAFVAATASDLTL